MRTFEAVRKWQWVYCDKWMWLYLLHFDGFREKFLTIMAVLFFLFAFFLNGNWSSKYTNITCVVLKFNWRYSKISRHLTNPSDCNMITISLFKSNWAVFACETRREKKEKEIKKTKMNKNQNDDVFDWIIESNVV